MTQRKANRSSALPYGPRGPRWLKWKWGAAPLGQAGMHKEGAEEHPDRPTAHAIGDEVLDEPPLNQLLPRLGGHEQEAETRELGERALEIRRRVLGQDHTDVADSLHQLAILRFFAGEYEPARVYWDEAMKIRVAALGPDDPAVAEVMNGLANLFQTTGDFTRALMLYRRALSIRGV